jgi:hypothetical protein
MDDDYKESTSVVEAAIAKADEGSTDGSEANQAQGQAQAAPAEPAFDPKAAYEELKQQYGNVGRELGQFRSMQSKMDKILSALQGGQQASNQPEILKTLPPEQIQNAEQLIEALWKKKFGSDWESMQNFREEMMVEKTTSQIESATRGLLGAEYEKLEPIMANIVQDAKAARDEGNEEAQEFLNTLHKMPRTGARILASLAREEFAKSLNGQSQQATNALKASGARASNSVPSTAKVANAANPAEMTIEQLREAAEKEAMGAL